MVGAVGPKSDLFFQVTHWFPYAYQQQTVVCTTLRVPYMSQNYSYIMKTNITTAEIMKKKTTYIIHTLNIIRNLPQHCNTNLAVIVTNKWEIMLEVVISDT